MSNKKKPPPPVLPPKLDKIQENYCLFHRGDIQGEIYQCKACETKYCLKCAKKAKAEGKKCIKCKQMIFLKT